VCGRYNIFLQLTLQTWQQDPLPCFVLQSVAPNPHQKRLGRAWTLTPFFSHVYDSFLVFYHLICGYWHSFSLPLSLVVWFFSFRKSKQWMLLICHLTTSQYYYVTLLPQIILLSILLVHKQNSIISKLQLNLAKISLLSNAVQLKI
jgi:hypothetical protein